MDLVEFTFKENQHAIQKLYQQIFGSSPWKVTDVELDRATPEIQVKVDHPKSSKFRCREGTLHFALEASQ